MFRNLLPFMTHLNVSRVIPYIFLMDKQSKKEWHEPVLGLK
jgi:hypothetical protein